MDKLLNSKFIFASQLTSKRIVKLENKNYLFSNQTFNEEESNNAIENYYQTGCKSDLRVNALLELFCQISKTPFFSQLRTKEQLGYTVFSGIHKMSTLLDSEVFLLFIFHYFL